MADSSFHEFQQTKRNVILWVFVLLGPLFLLGSTVEYFRHQRLVRNGVPTTAQVVTVELEQSSKAAANRMRLDVVYHTREAPKTRRKAEIYVYQTEYEASQTLQNAKALPILYDRDNPSRIALQGASSDAWLGILCGAVMTLVGLLGSRKSPRGKIQPLATGAKNFEAPN